MTSQLEHHVQKLQDRDVLNERVTKLEEELQLAEANVTKLVSPFFYFISLLDIVLWNL